MCFIQRRVSVVDCDTRYSPWKALQWIELKIAMLSWRFIKTTSSNRFALGLSSSWSVWRRLLQLLSHSAPELSRHLNQTTLILQFKLSSQVAAMLTNVPSHLKIVYFGISYPLTIIMSGNGSVNGRNMHSVFDWPVLSPLSSRIRLHLSNTF